jgi:hypothetical protein
MARPTHVDNHRLAAERAQGADWGLIEIGPEEGSYLGARVGTFAVYTNLPWPLGSQVYAVGYPASGVWRSPG